MSRIKNIHNRLIFVAFLIIAITTSGVYLLYFLSFEDRISEIDIQTHPDIINLNKAWQKINEFGQGTTITEGLLLDLYALTSTTTICIRDNKQRILNCNDENSNLASRIPNRPSELITASHRIVGPVKLSNIASNRYILVIQRSLPIKTALINILNYQRWKVILVIALCLTIIIATARYISAPLRKLKEITNSLEEGDWDVDIPKNIFSRHDEVGSLGRAIHSLQQALHRSFLAQKSLLMRIGHEINTPLTRIRLIGSLLEKNNTSTQQQLDVLIMSCEEIASISKQMMEFSKVCSGVLDSHKQATNMEYTISYEISRSTLFIETRQLLMQVDNTDCPTILINPDAAHIVVRNIIQNVLNYAPPLSKVNLQSRVEDGYWFFQCINLIENKSSFYDTKVSTSKGYGVGLRIVRQIILSCGGEVYTNRKNGIFHIWLRVPLVS